MSAPTCLAEVQQMRKILALSFAGLVVSSTAFAQVTSIETDNPAPKGQDLTKIVCEVQTTTGTRLDDHKVCKSVLEWQQMRREHREGVEQIQRQGTSVGCQEGQACGG
jgi:hypothetical protein